MPPENQPSGNQDGPDDRLIGPGDRRQTKDLSHIDYEYARDRRSACSPVSIVLLIVVVVIICIVFATCSGAGADVYRGITGLELQAPYFVATS